MKVFVIYLSTKSDNNVYVLVEASDLELEL